MDRQINIWKDGQADRRIEEWTEDGQTDAQTSRWPDRQNRWTDEIQLNYRWVDRQMKDSGAYRQMDSHTDSQTAKAFYYIQI